MKEAIDIKIERIFKENEIQGDIGYDESEEHFWKRKIVELAEKCEVCKKRGGSK